MANRRYLLGALAPWVFITACTPSTSSPTASPSATSLPTASSPEDSVVQEVQPSQTADLTSQDADKAPVDLTCQLLYAYDPEDTSVNVRDRPDGDIITDIPNFTTVSSEGPAGIEPGWNKLYVNDLDSWGYIWGDLLHRTHYQVQDAEDTSANLRQSPDGPVLTSVTNGTVVAFVGTTGDWTRVQTETGQQGYILNSLLTQPSCF
ncbi:MAG: SH3 domain-containing protein [Cyanobacteria bacterium J06598_1]